MTSTQAAPGTAAIDQRRLLVIIGALLLGMLLAALDQTIVATALPTIAGDLHGLSDLSWIVTAYILASTVSTPLWGKLGDLYGRKIFFQAAIVIFLVGSVLSGLSTSIVDADCFPGYSGHRRRRADDRRPGDRRRRGRAPGPGQVSGRLRGRVRGDQRDRPADRGVLRPEPVVAVGVLRQPARRGGRARGDHDRAAGRLEPGGSRHRLPRHDPAGGGRHQPGAADDPRRNHLPLGLTAGHTSWRRPVSSAWWPSCWWSAGRPSRCFRCGCSPTGYSPSAARSVSSSGSPCSARSPTCRSTCRSSGAPARSARAWSCCR